MQTNPILQTLPPVLLSHTESEQPPILPPPTEIVRPHSCPPALHTWRPCDAQVVLVESSQSPIDEDIAFADRITRTDPFGDFPQSGSDVRTVDVQT